MNFFAISYSSCWLRHEGSDERDEGRAVRGGEIVEETDETSQVGVEGTGEMVVRIEAGREVEQEGGRRGDGEAGSASAIVESTQDDDDGVEREVGVDASFETADGTLRYDGAGRQVLLRPAQQVAEVTHRQAEGRDDAFPFPCEHLRSRR
jgi:hypothetical protein